MTPVDVSACTTATMRLAFSRIFFSTASGMTGVPQANSRVSTAAPSLAATSLMRMPKTPLIRISTLSPGSMRFTKQASIPADPVPDMGTVMAFSVCRTCLSISLIPSMIVMK